MAAARARKTTRMHGIFDPSAQIGAAGATVGLEERRGRLGRLADRIEALLLAHRRKLSIVHAVMFVFFLGIVLVPAFLPEPAEAAGPLDDFTLFANYVMWGLWFPLVFLSVIVTGRSWCGLMCPMGAASEWGNARGLKRAIPAWIRWEGMPIVSFVIVTLLGQTIGVRDHPEAIAELFGGTMLAAIIVGLIWGRRRRAWCRHLCPIGLLLGVFSRLGAVEFRPKRKTEGGDRWVEQGPCPTMIDIARKEESRHCIQCARCLTRDPERGLALRLRRPGIETEAIRDHHANPYEIWFLFVGTGIALGGFLWLGLPMYQTMRQRFAEWAINQGWFWIGESGPAWLMSVHPERREVFVWLDFLTIVGFMIAAAILLSALLSAATAAASWLAGRVGGDRDFRTRFVELGYQFAPIAMVSLVIGLGGELFEGLRLVGLGDGAIHIAKAISFLLAFVWSVWLGAAILRRQAVSGGALVLPLLPGMAGSVLVGAAWWLAVIGF